MRRVKTDVYLPILNEKLVEFSKETPYNRTVCKKFALDQWHPYVLGLYEDDYRKVGNDGWYIYYAESVLEYRFIVRFFEKHGLDHCWESSQGDPTKFLLHQTFLRKLLPKEYRGYVIATETGIL